MFRLQLSSLHDRGSNYNIWYSLELTTVLLYQILLCYLVYYLSVAAFTISSSSSFFFFFVGVFTISYSFFTQTKIAYNPNTNYYNQLSIPKKVQANCTIDSNSFLHITVSKLAASVRWVKTMYFNCKLVPTVEIRRKDGLTV